MPSQYSSELFTVSYYEPLSQGSTWLGDLQISIKDWTHTTTGFGGFDRAEFTLQAEPTVMEEWAVNGLGRRIVSFDSDLDVMWEGFVDRIDIEHSGLVITYGPLTEVANRVKAIYSKIEVSEDNVPEVGLREHTAYQEDAASQAEWGIWPVVLSLAGVTDDNAEGLVSLYLSEFAQPRTSSNFSFKQAGISLRISCLGYIYTLSHPYNQTLIKHTVNMSDRLGAIVSSQLNPWLSTDLSKIQSNTTQVKAYQNDDQLALDQIRALVSMGDEDDNRYLFGIYENRQAIYEMVENEIAYRIELRDPSQSIYNVSGGLVHPWQVRPGRWVFFPDFIPGLGAPLTNLKEDPRMLFPESITFDFRVPFGVKIDGNRNSRYDQRLARLGLRGMDV